MVYRLIIIAFLVMPSIAQANSFVDVHLSSYHSRRNMGFNESNPGIIYRLEKDNIFYVSGIYYNSEYKMSGFVGAGRLFGKGNFQTSIAAGFVSGYQKTKLMALASVYIGPVILHFIPDPYNYQVVVSCSVNVLKW